MRYKDIAQHPNGALKSWSAKPATLAAERPVPWLIAGLVFLANALLSATRGDWWLAAFEAATAALAGLSALSISCRSSTISPPWMNASPGLGAHQEELPSTFGTEAGAPDTSEKSP
jgi:hypothetical protein